MTISVTEKNRIIGNAKLWSMRHKRTADENEAYLDALQDMGIPEKLALLVADILYCPVKLSDQVKR